MPTAVLGIANSAKAADTAVSAKRPSSSSHANSAKSSVNESCTRPSVWAKRPGSNGVIVPNQAWAPSWTAEASLTG
jgi:hypothetical protein